MTFQQLQYLLEVNRTRSISQAAKNQYVTSSSVSISINALEKELGYPIFIRTQHGLSPTPKGQTVIEYAKRIFDTYQQLNSIDQETRTYVRISTGSYEPIFNAYVRLVLENADRDDVSFAMYNYTTNEIIQKLVYSELDCGVVFNFEPRIHILETKLKKKNLQWRNLKSIPVYFIIGRGHPLYHKENITAQDFENDILLDGPARNLERSDFLRGYMTINSKRTLVAARSAVKYQLMAAGYGYMISNMPPNETIEKYGLRCIPMEGASYRLISIINPNNELSPEVKRFLEMLDEELLKV